jgi:hypothetical protein
LIFISQASQSGEQRRISRTPFDIPVKFSPRCVDGAEEQDARVEHREPTNVAEGAAFARKSPDYKNRDATILGDCGAIVHR